MESMNRLVFSALRVQKNSSEKSAVEVDFSSKALVFTLRITEVKAIGMPKRKRKNRRRAETVQKKVPVKRVKGNES